MPEWLQVLLLAFIGNITGFYAIIDSRRRIKLETERVKAETEKLEAETSTEGIIAAATLTGAAGEVVALMQEQQNRIVERLREVEAENAALIERVSIVEIENKELLSRVSGVETKNIELANHIMRLLNLVRELWEYVCVQSKELDRQPPYGLAGKVDEAIRAGIPRME